MYVASGFSRMWAREPESVLVSGFLTAVASTKLESGVGAKAVSRMWAASLL
jgi:hypothetical protein